MIDKILIIGVWMDILNKSNLGFYDIDYTKLLCDTIIIYHYDYQFTKIVSDCFETVRQMDLPRIGVVIANSNGFISPFPRGLFWGIDDAIKFSKILANKTKDGRL